MGVVYHANYLVWFEIGRSALVREMGLDYAQLEDEGYVSPVIKVEASYKSPARYGDEVTIRTWVQDYDGLRVTYAYEILVGERLCVTGSSVHVCVRTKDARPVAMKKSLPLWHEVYENLMQTGSC
jgi:acyl-CoA thioester hydrolase